MGPKDQSSSMPRACPKICGKHVSRRACRPPSPGSLRVGDVQLTVPDEDLVARRIDSPSTVEAHAENEAAYKSHRALQGSDAWARRILHRLRFFPLTVPRRLAMLTTCLFRSDK